jgi:RNAse (barnase) inhibitor barstar
MAGLALQKQSVAPMACFDRENLNRPDWAIFQNGWVAMYWRPEILDHDANWLASNQYNIYRFDCDRWTSKADALMDLGTALNFPEYYGQNLNAFNDCLSGIDVPIDGGVALVLRRYDRFAEHSRDIAQLILDICARNSRRFILFGQRLVTLVQSDDPNLSFDPVGSTSVMWNHREWFNKNRGL